MMFRRRRIWIRMVNTRAHAVTDYLIALILFCSPWIFDFSAGGTGYQVCVAAAVLIFLLAINTQFEYALLPWIPLRVHMWFDTLTGILLAVSPFVLDFKDVVFKPHVVFGATLVVVAALTDRVLHHQVKIESDEKIKRQILHQKKDWRER